VLQFFQLQTENIDTQHNSRRSHSRMFSRMNLSNVIVCVIWLFILLSDIPYTLARNTVSDDLNLEQNHSWSILVVSIGATQRSQSLQSIVQELALRGHRIRLVYPGNTDALMNSAKSNNIELVPLPKQVTKNNIWKTKDGVESFPVSKQPRVTKIPQFSESPVDHALRVLWHEKSVWKTLSYLPTRLLFPLRQWLFDILWKEIEKDKPDMIVADIGAFAAWDIADLFDIPLFLLYCGPLLPISSESALEDLFLPPPLSGNHRNVSVVQAGLFIFQKWLYEIYTSPALHKLNRLRWYRGLDSYGNIRDLFCRKHTYIFPTTFAFEIPRTLSSPFLLSGPIVSRCTENLPLSAIQLAQYYSEQIVLIDLEGAYLSKVTTLSLVNELHSLVIGFWWINGSYIQPDQFPNNFYSLQRKFTSCALSSALVRIVVVPCLSDVVQQVLYFGKPVLCVATGAVQRDVAARLVETHAGESIYTCKDTILDDLTIQLQDMFLHLESYEIAAMDMSRKIRASTCGLECIYNTMESTFSGSIRRENDNCSSIFSSIVGQSLYYCAVTCVILYGIGRLCCFFWWRGGGCGWVG